jgi:hypothetical protein
MIIFTIVASIGFIGELVSPTGNNIAAAVYFLAATLAASKD